MSRKLIPRLSSEQAGERLEEIEAALARGAQPADLVRIDLGPATLNPTGGEAPTQSDLHQWRQSVIERVDVAWRTKEGKDRLGVALGRAISECVGPSPSDAAHDGVWSFLTLRLFPDVVLRRWPSTNQGLPKDRWIGAQMGRDRNYLKLSWRRWRVLGTALEDAEMPLGEDEFGAILERTAMARNTRLIRAATDEVLAHTDGSRSEFAREFMKRLTYHSGPIHLDFLSDVEIAELVEGVADQVTRRDRPRRAIAQEAHLGAVGGRFN